MNRQHRRIFFFGNYFNNFIKKQSKKVQEKVDWTLELIATVERIPTTYLKHIEGTKGLYEIRVQSGSDIVRIFCFFDDDKLIVIISGFQKKTQKTPYNEIKTAEKIKKEYYETKK